MNATTTIDPKTIVSLGIQELGRLVREGQLTDAAAFGIVEGRIAKRIADKRPLIANVVAFRNELALRLAHPPMPMPTYPAKPAVKQAPAVSGGKDIDGLADEITASGIDIPALMTALAKRMPAPAVSG